jgi:hypothetical protein
MGRRYKTRMLHHNNAPAHMLLLHELLVKCEKTIAPTALLSRFDPCRYPPPRLKSILKGCGFQKRSERRKFSMGPTCYPAKRVPELETILEVVYRHWKGVL